MTVAGETPKLDANEIWEFLFNRTKDAVPEELTNEILVDLAAHINKLWIDPLTDEHRREAEAGTCKSCNGTGGEHNLCSDCAGSGAAPDFRLAALADLEAVRKAVFGDIGDCPDIYADYDIALEMARKMTDALKSLAASPSSPASGVRVKALAWVQSSFGGQAWRAHSILGLYRVAMGSTAGWAFEGYDGTEVSQRADNIDAAKAAAQADYEARIRSALGEHP